MQIYRRNLFKPHRRTGFHFYLFYSYLFYPGCQFFLGFRPELLEIEDIFYFIGTAGCAAVVIRLLVVAFLFCTFLFGKRNRQETFVILLVSVAAFSEFRSEMIITSNQCLMPRSVSSCASNYQALSCRLFIGFFVIELLYLSIDRLANFRFLSASFPGCSSGAVLAASLHLTRLSCLPFPQA